MNDGTISINMGKVITAALWALVALLLLGAWLTWFTADSHRGVAYLLGFTACSTSAAAATAHVRVYSVQLCALIRMAAGVESRREKSLHTVRE